MSPRFFLCERNDMRKTRAVSRFLSLIQKRFVAILLLLLQLFLYAYFVFSSSKLSGVVTAFFWVLGIAVALCVVTRKGDTAYKLAWIFFILAFPLFGGFLYLLLVGNLSQWRFKRKVATSVASLPQGLRLAGESDALGRERREIRYLTETLSFSLYDGTDAAFLPSGEEMFKELKQMLRGAERYIFLEFFIVSEGEMWGEILDILEEKAKNGVTVRVIYDDMGSLFSLPSRYKNRLTQLGIDAYAFNPFVPFLRLEQNNRDHRKIAVADGKVAITGGVNLADEYINRIDKHGHWNDAAVMVSGKAAWALTVFFLHMWEVCAGKREDVAFFLPTGGFGVFPRIEGGVVPYADDPTDDEAVGEQVYLHMITSARRYVYITTPYLIIDDKMLCALTSAAKSGVDVRVVLPHHWDKRIVHATTRTYYRELIRAGVRVYEYTPGFMHAKTVVSDDEVATVGTVNFDFRSLYLHFECGVLFYHHPVIRDVKENFLRITECSEEIRILPRQKGLLARLWASLLRLFSPLM